jgi:hypothetical protein
MTARRRSTLTRSTAQHFLCGVSRAWSQPRATPRSPNSAPHGRASCRSEGDLMRTASHAVGVGIALRTRDPRCLGLSTDDAMDIEQRRDAPLSAPSPDGRPTSLHAMPSSLHKPPQQGRLKRLSLTCGYRREQVK